MQDGIIKLLPSDAILVGQSLNCDLEALKVKKKKKMSNNMIKTIFNCINVCL